MAPPKLSPPPAPRLKWPGPVRPPEVTEDNRIIGEERIYDLLKVKELVKKHGVVILNDATADGMLGKGSHPLPLPEWSNAEFAQVILALTDDDFINSQWCMLVVKKYLDCDSYAVHYNRSKGIRCDPTIFSGMKIYVKFGFNPNLTVPSAILCRLHIASR